MSGGHGWDRKRKGKGSQTNGVVVCLERRFLRAGDRASVLAMAANIGSWENRKGEKKKTRLGESHRQVEKKRHGELVVFTDGGTAPGIYWNPGNLESNRQSRGRLDRDRVGPSLPLRLLRERCLGTFLSGQGPGGSSHRYRPLTEERMEKEWRNRCVGPSKKALEPRLIAVISLGESAAAAVG